MHVQDFSEHQPRMCLLLVIKYNVYSSFDLNLRYLYGFEEYCRSAQIQFRTVHHNEPRPDSQPEAQSIKAVKKESEDADEMMQQVTAEPGTSEDKPAADADESDAESEKGRKDICSPRVSVSVCLSVVLLSGCGIFMLNDLPAAQQ